MPKIQLPREKAAWIHFLVPNEVSECWAQVESDSENKFSLACYNGKFEKSVVLSHSSARVTTKADVGVATFKLVVEYAGNLTIWIGFNGFQKSFSEIEHGFPGVQKRVDLVISVLDGEVRTIDHVKHPEWSSVRTCTCSASPPQSPLLSYPLSASETLPPSSSPSPSRTLTPSIPSLGVGGLGILRYIVDLHLRQAIYGTRVLPTNQVCPLVSNSLKAEDTTDILKVAWDIAVALNDQQLLNLVQSIGSMKQ